MQTKFSLMVNQERDLFLFHDGHLRSAKHRVLWT